MLVLASVGVVIGQDHRVIALIVLGKRVPLEYGGVLAQGDGLRLVAAVIGAALALISAAGGQGECHHQHQYRRERPFYFNFHLHFLLFHGTSAFTALILILVLPGYCGILPRNGLKQLQQLVGIDTTVAVGKLSPSSCHVTWILLSVASIRRGSSGW